MRRFPSRASVGIAFAALLTAALLAATPAASWAQTVRGTVLEAGTEAVVEGAIATLLDEEGASRGAALTDGAGGFRLRAPGPGTYRVKVERIGYATLTTEPIRLAGGETAVRRILLPVEAVALSSIVVSASDPCATRPDTAEKLRQVWGEAQKALEAARLSRRRVGREFEWVRRERRLDHPSLIVLDERVIVGTTLDESPFKSRPAEEIAREGWATILPEEIHYYGPDVDALLSDWFVEDHCFQLVREGGRIGLSFRPFQRGERIELAGVLWLDEGSAELRALEFRYVGLPYERAEALAGGEARFARLDDGRWILAEWTLRAPELELGTRDHPGRVLAILETTGTARPRARVASPTSAYRRGGPPVPSL
jgi:hypothetical protein